MTMTNLKTNHDHDELQQRLRQLGLWGLAANFDEVCNQPWLNTVIQMQETEKQRRGLQRRIKDARLGKFKSMADFDWTWAKKLDRELLEDLLQLGFIREGANAVLLGPNGVGKTMIAYNIAHQAVLAGYTARCITASDMLDHLASTDSEYTLTRRLKRFCQPRLLLIDEVGYLSYDNRYADLLFEVVTRRYKEERSIILTTNKPFSEWSDVFPNAACVVTLIDRLLHRAEVLSLEGASFRLKEATERTAAKAKSRTKKRSARKSRN
jgi:DNA replication protein DnaC